MSRRGPLGHLAAAVAARQVTPLSLEVLATLRRNALESVLERHRGRAAALAGPLREGGPEARSALADLAERALGEFRAAVTTVASRRGITRATEALDRAWRTDAPELMDDPTLAPARRTRIIGALDRWNRLIDSYGAFLDTLRPLLRHDGPTRILDLAAGHGGFALALARSARREGLALDVTATDLRQEYLDVGQAHADRLGLDVTFRVQDALDLSDLGADAADLIISTQAIHHFPPGLVAVMFEAAARAATRGVVFIDGCRSAWASAPLATVGALYLGSLDFVHDGVLSLRRFFVPEELELLARIGPWGDGARARWTRPGHCLLTLDKRRAAPAPARAEL